MQRNGSKLKKAQQRQRRLWYTIQVAMKLARIPKQGRVYEEFKLYHLNCEFGSEIPTNSMNKTFATLKNYIKPDDYLNSVKAFFVMQDTYKEFPDNDKFEGAFVSRDIYNMRARNYILSRLENFENKAPIIMKIIPQNI